MPANALASPAPPLPNGPAAPALRWLHEDEQRIVVDKPAGLLSVPGRGEDKQDCAWLRVRGRAPDALVVHRLDQATSGLLVFARGEAMQRALSLAFAARQVHKRYQALVHGRLREPRQEIALPLIADWPNRPRQMVDPQRGKPSLTRVRLLRYDARRDLSHVELEPVTGRSHQLRVHLMAIGHPILGDALYAPPELQAPRLMLHACELGLPALLGAAALRLNSAPDFLDLPSNEDPS
ncbi:RluA family pseudouridine synthase [Pelomonas sp. CA6]|uniref:RluA family pseudouridine synthase n=1 Tax=Pelomonas sp. CA6 TaxID=2907999 RepID=UPI001F4C398D|nr:RluA family pseudouridine synthase [Pelomonas sp. CA6]MCH7345002.1 RluA family pseudouridine synthase [Pelomonas sp. CA6]